ncbi:MAG: Hsp20/alpha crystallin family protein [Chloracidobacterium sp.]|nr:Hsp20/alpha crystallin family protein [Chloracidobacterium sp.]
MSNSAIAATSGALVVEKLIVPMGYDSNRVSHPFLWAILISIIRKGDEKMAGMKKDEIDENSQHSGGLEHRGTRIPSHFPISAREFMGAPLEMARRFSEEMGRAFGHMVEDMSRSWERDFGEFKAWSPAVEVFTRDNNLVVRAELPGMNKEDVKVDITDEGMLIHGERKREKEEEHEGWYRSERSYGEFRRLIPMPEGVNVDEAKARFENGVLEITAPIPESSRRRRSVPIEIGGGQAAQTAGGGSIRR